jgi:hypothetical protein
MELIRKTNGIEHGLLGTLVNQVPKKKGLQNIDAKKREDREKKMKDDSEMVEVRYINYRNQKTGTRYVDWSAGAGMPIFLYRFLHDQTYTVPKGLVATINDPRKRRPIREGSIDPHTNAPREKDEGSFKLDEFVRNI